MIKHCYFITGTDTDIGKTTASAALLQAANNYGYITAAYKPISSGTIDPKLFYNRDALILQKYSTLKLIHNEINPYSFKEATAPHIISNDNNINIDFSILSSGLNTLKYKAELIVVEGIGGWFTPISKEHTFADWVIKENLPVILVVGIRVGCINHAILTAQAVKQSGLFLIGWIANNINQFKNRHNEYIDSLKLRIPAPLIGEIPWLGEKPDLNNIGSYLKFELLH